MKPRKHDKICIVSCIPDVIIIIIYESELFQNFFHESTTVG